MDSPEKCIAFRDTNCITPALAMMAKDPAYSFTMENMLNLREYLERHPERAEEIGTPDPGGPDGVGGDVQSALRIAPHGRAARPADVFRPALAQADRARRRRARLLQSRRPRTGRPDAADPGQGRHPLHGHEPLSRGLLPLGQPRRKLRPDLLAGALRQRRGLSQRPAGRGRQDHPRQAGQMDGLLRRPRPAGRVSPAQFGRLLPADRLRAAHGLWNAAAGRAKPVPQGGAAKPVMQYSTARKFFEALDVKTAKLETITGERPGLWLYIHGPTHHWAISAAREAARLLPAAEAFSTIRALLEGDFFRLSGRAPRGRLASRDLSRPRLGRQGGPGHRPALPQEIRVRPRRGPGRARRGAGRDRRPCPGSIRPRAFPSSSSTACPGR